MKSKYALFPNMKVTKIDRSAFWGTPGIDPKEKFNQVGTIYHTNFFSSVLPDHIYMVRVA